MLLQRLLSTKGAIISGALALTLLLAGCSAKSTRPILTSYSAIEPSLIGVNLIPNPSFEYGTGETAAGWEGCSRVEADSHTGKFSLLASSSDDTETICLSDSIPVRSGHYDLTLWFKARDLNFRGGESFGDKIRFRIRLYDSEGSEVDPVVQWRAWQVDSQDLEDGLRRVDDAKAFDALPFSQLHLIPRLHAYDSGWFDSNVSSVRVEISVERASLLIDDVELKPTKWNLPLSERVQIEKERSPNADRLEPLFPAPQKLAIGRSVKLNPNADKICILQAGAFRFATEQVVIELEDKLRQYGFGSSLSRGKCQDASYVIAVGERNVPPDVRSSLTKTFSHGSEEYHIAPFKRASGQSGVAITSGGPRGEVYGLQSLSQLFHPAGDGVEFQEASVIDYPAIKLRAVGGGDSRHRGFRQEITAAREWLPNLRMNALFIAPETASPFWWQKNSELLSASRAIGKESVQDGLLDYGLLFNPWAHLPQKTTKVFQLSERSSLEELYGAIKQYLDFGAKFILLRADDFLPHEPEGRYVFTFDNDKDRERFSSLAAAHAHMINFVYARMKKEYPKAQLQFCPPWYNNLFVYASHGSGEKYLKELSALVPRDVLFYWTGPVVRSSSIDAIHYELFSRLAGRKLLIWDNTLYARRAPEFWGGDPERATLASYLEPFDVESPPDIWKEGEGVFINASVTELYRIQLATTAAFLWNPEQYQPEKALWRYLTDQYGSEGAELILHFDSLLWEFKRERFKNRSEKPDEPMGSVANRLREEAARTLQQMVLVLGAHAGDLVDELRELYFQEFAE